MEEDLSPNSKPVSDNGTPTGNKDEKDKATVKFLSDKKRTIKRSQYRERFDALAAEIDLNIINTTISYGQKIYEKSGWGSMVFYNKMANGAYDINVYPQKLTDRDQNRSGVPVSQEPIALSKILIATSVLAGKQPDAKVIADDKIYAKATHDLWKRGWSLKGGNGENTLSLTYQNLFTYGWAAWRVYPKKLTVKRNGVDKILFDDIYREPMDPKRTWLGLGFTNGDYWSQFEVLYEKDMLKSEFYAKYPIAKTLKLKLDVAVTSEDSKDEDQEKSLKSVTITYYENVLLNRYIVACGKFVIYDGELPNDDNFGSVVVARCFVKNILDPYGVGLYEMMRGNTAMFTYINSLNAQQVEAEIFPLLFGPQVQNGTATYKRSPNVINPKNPGTTIDVVKTSGNVQQGIAFADKQKTAIEENTGVNNIIAGSSSETTLGSTVILKEAATNRLTPARNSMVNALQTDAHISTSWIKQTFSVDKVFMIDSQKNVAEFAKQNPDYFVEHTPIVNNGIQKGSAVTASQNLRLTFDFTPDGELLENVPTRTISKKKLFDSMSEHGHISDYYEFIIDPDSMLLPSMEIQKQTFIAIFPVITNQLNQIFDVRHSRPDLAASQLMALEKFLDIEQQDIFDFISKQDYDAIIGRIPSPFPPPIPMKTPAETLNYKDAPEDVKREIEAQAGLQPSQNGGLAETTGTVDRKITEAVPASPGEESAPVATPPPPPAPVSRPPGTMNNLPGVSSNRTGGGKPLGNNQIATPRGPLGSAVDASVGRAGNLPFFPK